jgi:hypothetical protein
MWLVCSIDQSKTDISKTDHNHLVTRWRSFMFERMRIRRRSVFRLGYSIPTSHEVGMRENLTRTRVAAIPRLAPLIHPDDA